MFRQLVLTLALLGLTTPAVASDWALEEWLAEPDVKLVAVEFYADWCQPCKKAAPKWEALRKKYASQGLKLVVVNLSEKPGGGQARCTRLPWNPDESLCDPALGRRLGVESLPEAFVWSWQGNLLVDRGQHVREIEQVIRRYLDDNPRVQVVATDTKGRPDKALQRQVEGIFARSGKLTIVPDAEMRKRLAAVRKASHRGGARDDQRCALGAEVSANSLLTVERFPGSLSLTLADAQSGCQRATANVPWQAQRAERSVEKAVFKLMAQLKRRRIEMPGGGASPSDAGDGDTWEPEADALINVKFDSEPPGARVTLDGAVVCKETPCKRDVASGRHQVSMTLERHVAVERIVSLSAGQMVGWSLTPDFGTLTVRSKPSGVAVSIGGKAYGKTPLEAIELSPGEHVVTVNDSCYAKLTRKLTLPRGKSHTMDLALESRPAGLKISAVDDAGDALDAGVFVDGVEVGRTPTTVRVAVCAQQVEVRLANHQAWKDELSLRAKQTTTVQARLVRTSASKTSSGSGGNSEFAGPGGFTLEAFERTLFDERAKKIQSKMTTIRKKKIRTLESIVQSNRPYRNKADVLFRLAEAYWQEAKYTDLLAYDAYDEALQCFLEQRCSQQPTAPVQDFASALKLYRSILREFPTYRRIDEVLYYLGRAALREGQARNDRQLQKEAVKRLTEIVQRYPRSKFISQAHLALGEYFFDTESLFYAKVNFEKIVENFQRSPMFNYARYKLGGVYFKLREFEKSAETLETVKAALDGGSSPAVKAFLARIVKDLRFIRAAIDGG